MKNLFGLFLLLTGSGLYPAPMNQIDIDRAAAKQLKFQSGCELIAKEMKGITQIFLHAGEDNKELCIVSRNKNHLPIQFNEDEVQAINRYLYYLVNEE